MSGYKDKTWCPSEIHEKCKDKPTCERVMTKKEVKESEGGLIWWLAGKPSCFKDNK